MKKKIFKISILFFFIIGFLVISIHNVSKNITSEDKVAILQITDSLEIDKNKLREDLEYQLKTIDAVQELVVKLIEPSATGIPLGAEREPINVLNFLEGQCFDRSRLIEKILIFYGFRTRHLSIYHSDYHSTLKILTSKNVSSHASTEVKTLKGWLIIDSNSDWSSISSNGHPLSFQQLENDKLLENPEKTLIPFYLDNSTVIYGLYSRHGQFYPPFNRIPDFNCRELLYNFGF